MLPAGYRLRSGSGLERSLLLKFMQRTYAEQGSSGDQGHLAQTVDQYLSPETPFWWVEPYPIGSESKSTGLSLTDRRPTPIACLWLGTAIDQSQGDRHTHIFLLYVAPAHRRRGIGSALMRHAEAWARERGDRQIGLQVFATNQPALALYHNLGFQAQSFWMVKPLDTR